MAKDAKGSAGKGQGDPKMPVHTPDSKMPVHKPDAKMPMAKMPEGMGK